MENNCLVDKWVFWGCRKYFRTSYRLWLHNTVNILNVTELYIENTAYAYAKSPSINIPISENLLANTRYSIKFVWPRALGAYFNIGQYRPGYYSFTGKIYRAEFVPQFSKNATALLIPCYRKSDLEPGFYDVINNIFYSFKKYG